jgi:hypothetical protein
VYVYGLVVYVYGFVDGLVVPLIVILIIDPLSVTTVSKENDPTPVSTDLPA